jgi:hypothetical protein
MLPSSRETSENLSTYFLYPNLGSNVPFVEDTQQSYMSVGAGMFKDSSLMGTFLLPPPPLDMNIAPINMISSSTSGSLWYINPWVVPHPEDVKSY